MTLKSRFLGASPYFILAVFFALAYFIYAPSIIEENVNMTKYCLGGGVKALDKYKCEKYLKEGFDGEEMIDAREGYDKIKEDEVLEISFGKKEFYSSPSGVFIGGGVNVTIEHRERTGYALLAGLESSSFETFFGALGSWAGTVLYWELCVVPFLAVFFAAKKWVNNWLLRFALGALASKGFMWLLTAFYAWRP